MHNFSQVHPVSRITGEGMADKYTAWGPVLDQEEGGGEAGRRNRRGS